MKLFRNVLVLMFAAAAQAQTTVDNWQVAAPQTYPFISRHLNKISNAAALNPLFEKLYKIKKDHKGVVRIVHIGDSHLQADMITSVLRHGVQDYFGNAGRGMVFPYQLAKSNAPRDISATSNTVWQYNRLAHPEIAIVNGLSGFGIHTSAPKANISFYLRPQDSATSETFDRVQFFTGLDSNCYTVTLPQMDDLLSARSNPRSDTPSFVVNMPQPVSSFTLSRCNGDIPGTIDLYGMSLEKKNTPGVIYHSIGVNGAQYQQYTNTPLFWQQLPALKADCYIISLGTNEAQRLALTEAVFMTEIDSFVQKIHQASPNAVIVLTTPAGSYYHAKRPNAILKITADAMVNYCEEHKMAYWDLYRTSGGFTGAVSWKKNKLLGHDLVHYNPQGYQLQGQLLLDAFANAFNKYIEKKEKK